MTNFAIYDPKCSKSAEEWAKSEAYRLWKEPTGPKSANYFHRHFVKETVNGQDKMLSEATWKNVLKAFNNGEYDRKEAEKTKIKGYLHTILLSSNSFFNSHINS